MSNISDWIKYELYPSLFEHIDIAFPEHRFRRYSGGWKSKTYLNGSVHKNRDDKTVITNKAPGIILEQGGEVMSLIDYVIMRDRVDFITALQILASYAGIRLPQTDFTQVSYTNYQDKSALLEDCNSYFVYCLRTSTSSEAAEITSYLNSRGYSSEDIDLMELGYIPSQSKLHSYLSSKNYSQILIDEVLNLKKDTRIGTTHRLSIPYRSGGNLKGFKFRSVSADISPKYLNSIGLDRLGGFFNISALKSAKDILIVEGELDSLSASIRGISNVVATGGSNISIAQIIDAKKRGANSFTICFDREPSKEQGTIKRINTAIQLLLDCEVSRIYIATLPDLNGIKTDVDILLKEKGVNFVKELINFSVPYYEFQFNTTLNRYNKTELSPKEIDSLLEEILIVSFRIPDVISRDIFRTLVMSNPVLQDLGITTASFQIAVDNLTYSLSKTEQSKDLKKLLSEASNLQNKGEILQAIDLLHAKVKEVKLKDKRSEFTNLLVPLKEDDIKLRLSCKPASLYSGYTIKGEELLLPSGAISIFAAPTSHGKTTFLLNLAINVSEMCQNQEVYFFSYEEDTDSILLNALNIFINTEISFNNRKSLRSYFSTNSTEYIKNSSKEIFETSKTKFFEELIYSRRLNLRYVSYTSETLIDAIRFLKTSSKPAAIFIDYIQLLNLPEGKYKTYSRQEEIKEICISLKDVAVETGLPIILGAQFNREVVSQLKLHPTKIGEAGDIERIANLIVGFWNNNFKSIASDGELKEIKEKGCTFPNSMYINVLKNRDGKVGYEEVLSFNGNTGKINNMNNISNMNNIDNIYLK